MISYWLNQIDLTRRASCCEGAKLELLLNCHFSDSIFFSFQLLAGSCEQGYCHCQHMNLRQGSLYWVTSSPGKLILNICEHGLVAGLHPHFHTGFGVSCYFLLTPVLNFLIPKHAQGLARPISHRPPPKTETKVALYQEK